MAFTFLLVFGLHTVLSLSFNEGFPPKCKNFTDTRATAMDDFGRTFLTIPAHLTSNGQKDIRFFLANNHGISFAATHEEQCKSPDVVEIPLTVDAGHQSVSSKYPFQDQWKFTNDTYFTVDGYLHRQSNFWNPEDYCIELISDSELLVKTCKLNCSADLSKTYLLTSYNEPYEPSRICIPKCCGIDETLSLNDQTCRKLNDIEPNYFMPYLHIQQEIWFLKESKMKNVDTHKVLVRPLLGRRQTWNNTHGISGGGKIWDLLNFKRNKMNCSRFSMESVLYSDVTNNGQNRKNRHNFRVEVKSGGVKITLLTRSRKWLEYKQEFCIDGLDGWGISKENVEAVNQVVLMCQTEVDAESSNIIKYVDEHKITKATPVEYAYMIVTLLVTVLLLMGSIMFWQIRKKLNFKGNLIRFHLNAVASLYMYQFVALVVLLSEHDLVDSNAVTVVSSEYKEGKRIGWFCVLIGVVCHYVYMSIFFWIGAMIYYDLGKYSENIRKRMSILIGLGVPLVLMIGFGIADIVYSDPWSDIIVPDYGVDSCFIATWSAGYYLHLPVAITIGLIFFYAFVSFIRSNLGKNKIVVNMDSTGISLVVVVLTALTFRWIIDATKWLREYSGEKEDHWFQIILLFFGRIVPALVIFHVYCINEVVLGLAGDKMSSVQRLAKILKQKKLIWEGRGLIGQICDEVID